ncbi:ribosome-associated heat shock protein Hsp15 [Glaciecola sp. 2405UD65-10]|uniref:ribosome-associated heat shock protein Hsp15 n=1 Tax=Glaciecola sp. 2405UD65-10 TaxID=3397244 RepID=UPI003B58DB4D
MTKNKGQTQGRGQSNIESLRLDKWLWAARFCKTRSIARDLISSGKVQYNQQRAKPSRVVELGAIIKVPAGYDEKIVKVLKLHDKRLGAELAQLLFEETPESIAQREKNNQARKLSLFHSPRPDSRPDKKQRRQIIKFKHQ